MAHSSHEHSENPTITTTPMCCAPTAFLLSGLISRIRYTIMGSERLKLPKTPLNWQQATAIYFQLLDAVDHMHHRLDNNIMCLHRDISPSNVCVSWPHGPNGEFSHPPQNNSVMLLYITSVVLLICRAPTRYAL